MGKPQRREPPEPESIGEVLRQVSRARGPRESKLTVRIPEHLHARLKQTAEGITDQRRGGLQDLVIILLEYGLEAMEQGELKVRRDVRTTSFGIHRER